MQIVVSNELFEELEIAIKRPMNAREAITMAFEKHNPVIASILDRLDELVVVAHHPHRAMVLKRSARSVTTKVEEIVEFEFFSEPGMVAPKPLVLKHWMMDGRRFDDLEEPRLTAQVIQVNPKEMQLLRTFKDKPFAATWVRRLLGYPRSMIIDEAVEENKRIRFVEVPPADGGELDFPRRVFLPYNTTETLSISAWGKDVNILHMTVGLPRSGKSTWAKQQGVPVVSLDAIRLALHGREYLQEAEDHVHLFAKTMVKALFKAGHHHVILDSTAITKERRLAWHSDDYMTMYHNFDVASQICAQRALDAGKRHLLAVIDRMASARDEINWQAENAFGVFHYVTPA